MKKSIQISILMSLFFLCIGCKSIQKDMETYIYIMVYDDKDNALKDVQIVYDGNELGCTDIYGRYILVNKNIRKEIELLKAGYDHVFVSVNENQDQVIYVKMNSGCYYAEESEHLLDQGKYQDALELIDKALECENRKDFKYLKEIITGRLENE